MIKKKNASWALVFWPESSEFSIISVDNIGEAVKPQLIRVNWCGELPWVDDDNITTLYEAKLLKISRNKDYLESLFIDIFGKIIKRSYPHNIMAEKKKIKTNKREKEKVQRQTAKARNNLTQTFLRLTGVSKNRLSPPVVDEARNPSLVAISTASTVAATSKVPPVINVAPLEEVATTSMESGSNVTSCSTIESKNSEFCANCSQCICKDWRSNVTAKQIEFMELQLRGMKRMLSIADPLSYTIAQQKMELFPATGIFLTHNQLNLCRSKSNFKSRELVRLLLSEILTNEELIEFNTATTMNEKNPNIRNAIIGYLRHECDIIMSSTEFNDIVKRKIQSSKLAMKTDQELMDYKAKGRERAKRSRAKKQLHEDSLNTPSKKIKVATCHSSNIRASTDDADLSTSESPDIGFTHDDVSTQVTKGNDNDSKLASFTTLQYESSKTEKESGIFPDVNSQLLNTASESFPVISDNCEEHTEDLPLSADGLSQRTQSWMLPPATATAVCQQPAATSLLVDHLSKTTQSQHWWNHPQKENYNNNYLDNHQDYYPSSHYYCDKFYHQPQEYHVQPPNHNDNNNDINFTRYTLENL